MGHAKATNVSNDPARGKGYCRQNEIHISKAFSWGYHRSHTGGVLHIPPTAPLTDFVLAGNSNPFDEAKPDIFLCVSC